MVAANGCVGGLMPRAKSDKIITHRIEMGKWERDQIAPIVQLTGFATSVSLVGAAAAAGVGVYALYWAYDALYGIAGRISDSIEGSIDVVQGAIPSDIPGAGGTLQAGFARRWITRNFGIKFPKWMGD